MTQVLKKDGSIEDFDPEKIKRSVISAGQDAGLDQATISQLLKDPIEGLIKSFQEKEQISAKEIRDKILSSLKPLASALVSAWERFEKESKG